MLKVILKHHFSLCLLGGKKSENNFTQYFNRLSKGTLRTSILCIKFRSPARLSQTGCLSLYFLIRPSLLKPSVVNVLSMALIILSEKKISTHQVRATLTLASCWGKKKLLSIPQRTDPINRTSGKNRFH